MKGLLRESGARELRPSNSSDYDLTCHCVVCRHDLKSVCVRKSCICCTDSHFEADNLVTSDIGEKHPDFPVGSRGERTSRKRIPPSRSKKNPVDGGRERYRGDQGEMELNARFLRLVEETTGILQSEVWKRLGTNSREGSRIAIRLERRRLIQRERVLSNGRWSLRLTRLTSGSTLLQTQT